jgi:hypothetical protein
MDPGFMERKQPVVRGSIAMRLQPLIALFLLGLLFGFAIGKDVSQSGSMTVVPSSKGDLSICPRQQPGRLGVKEYVV